MWLTNFLSLISGSYIKRHAGESSFAETHPYEKGFSYHYKTFIKPHVQEFENSRIRALNSARKRLFICLGITPFIALLPIVLPPIIPVLLLSLFLLVPCFVIYIIVYCIFLRDSKAKKDKSGVTIIKWYNPLSIFFIGLFLFILVTFSVFSVLIYPLIAMSVVYWPIKKYKLDIKEKVFPEIISFVGEYSYKPKIGDYVNNYKDSGILPKFDKEKNEDFFKGSYKKVNIDFFESRLLKEHRSDKSSYYRTVFEGIIMLLSVNKPFNGHTILKKDGGKIGNLLTKTPSRLERVRLEDPDFERLFEVFSSDQVEARYLLTTAFMQRLLNLIDKFNGSSIQCSFYNNRLLIIIPVSKNMFETGSMFEPEDFVDDCKSLLAEMYEIQQIIDILKMDNDIGF